MWREQVWRGNVTLKQGMISQKVDKQKILEKSLLIL